MNKVTVICICKNVILQILFSAKNVKNRRLTVNFINTKNFLRTFLRYLLGVIIVPPGEHELPFGDVGVTGCKLPDV